MFYNLSDEEDVSGWVEHRSRDGYTYYYNNKTDKHSWTPPEGYEGTSPYLSREEIQVSWTNVCIGNWVMYRQMNG